MGILIDKASATQGCAMKRHTWIIVAVVGMLVWVGTGPGVAQAQVIYPVTNPPAFAFPPNTSSSVTVSIFQGATNVTGAWLPEPDQPVTLVVNVGGVPDPTAAISLVSPVNANPIVGATLTTSAYPGRCTNFDNSGGPGDIAIPDFTFDAVTKTLTPSDCGGMAVIQVTVAGGPSAGTYTFVLPQDTDFDGLPDIWEAQYCPAGATQKTCLSPTADTDPPPVTLTGSPTGDGIAVFDEYRGFIVSGVHIRTNPLQKDLFVHLVNSQCSTNESPPNNTLSRLGRASLAETHTIYPTDQTPAAALTLSATSGTGVSFTAGAAVFNPSHVGADILAATGVATITAFVSQTAVTAKISTPFAGTSLASGAWTIRPSLFGNLNNLISGTQVHLIGYTPRATNLTTAEWVDRFFRYTETIGFEYKLNPADTTTTTTAPADDRQINKNAIYPLTDAVTGTIQKGLRITECLDEGVTSPLGLAGRGSPNGPDNALLYTKRIVNSLNSAVAAGGTKPLKYSTFVGGAWLTPALVNGTGNPAVAANVDFIISGAMLYYLAMEIGHAVQLTSTVITGKGGTSYGYHYAPNTGDNLDQAITTKVSSSANTFWIPSLFNTTGQGSFKAKN